MWRPRSISSVRQLPSRYHPVIGSTLQGTSGRPSTFRGWRVPVSESALEVASSRACTGALEQTSQPASSISHVHRIAASRNGAPWALSHSGQRAGYDSDETPDIRLTLALGATDAQGVSPTTARGSENQEASP